MPPERGSRRPAVRASGPGIHGSGPPPASDNTTDEARLRALPSQALPPQVAEKLFTAPENGVSEQDLTPGG
ncbi:hypothetical protein [Streptomyces sp. NBC_00162]|uniref:hypothetical protein n=1 Tax=Streptomyces sp. NBC_00162 TaxID=2903629 RepID=UPI00214B518A|nr:hypothetical protein [Streptomyces sp. NBC_00162]UUU37711.1 hypothetical protein JIW86_01555 [Streptomyces sp. NBC_00162]